MTQITLGDLTVADISHVATVAATGDGPADIFEAARALSQRVLGHQLFTIMAVNMEQMQVRRQYSSNPDAYPVGGWKEKRDTEWGHHVLEQGRPFVGRSAKDIRLAFDDSDLILSLGLESVLNVPIRLYGRTVGTMNLLHRADYYQQDHIEAGRLLAGQLVTPLVYRMSGDN